MKPQVLIIGTDPNGERLESAIVAGGVRARRVGTDNAMAVVIANCPELTVLLGEAAHDGGADFCDALGHDVRSVGLDVLIVTASEAPPEVTLNRHAAIVSPDLTPTRLAPLILGLMQWGDPVGQDGRPLSLAHRVEALLHILEQRLVGHNRASSRRFSRPPLRSTPARENTPRVSRPLASARKTPVVTFREHDPAALDRMSIPARGGGTPRADETPLAVTPYGGAVFASDQAPSTLSTPAASTEAAGQSAQAPIEARDAASEPGAHTAAVAPSDAEAAARVSVLAEAPTSTFDPAPPQDELAAPLVHADSPAPAADPAAEASDAEASAAADDGVHPHPRPARASERPAPWLTGASERPAASLRPRSGSPAGRSRASDWWARGVGALALVASVAVLYQQTREEPPAPAVARIVVPDSAKPATPPPAASRPVAAAQAVPAEPERSVADTEPLVTPSDEPHDKAAPNAASQPGFEQRLAQANSLIDEGLYYERQKNFRVAATRYQQALELAPSYARALRASVRASMQLHDKNQAVAAAELLVKHHPTEAAHFLLLGDAYDRAGASERAKQAWRAAADSGNAAARARLARVERTAAPTSGSAAPRAAAAP